MVHADALSGIAQNFSIIYSEPPANTSSAYVNFVCAGDKSGGNHDVIKVGQIMNKNLFIYNEILFGLSIFISIELFLKFVFKLKFHICRHACSTLYKCNKLLNAAFLQEYKYTKIITFVSNTMFLTMHH